MPRRTRSRTEQRNTPKDLTSERPAYRLLNESLATPRPRPVTPAQEVRLTAAAERKNAERQRQARLNDGIDWSICLVPGCGIDVPGYIKPLNELGENHDPEVWLPLCGKHGATAWRNMNRIWKNAEVQREMFAADQRFNDQAAEHSKRRDLGQSDDSPAEFIYFIRQNGLVKVGWSSQIAARLKSYGPNVEILCYYPGTRHDETQLHRQLRPSLAKGREWYHDDELIELFLKDALERHGEPTFKPWWSAPKKPSVRLRNRR